MVRKAHRRTGEVSWGYFDTKSWEPFETIVGSYPETLKEIARLEALARLEIIGHYRNGLPIKISGEHIEEAEPEDLEEENDENV